MHSTNLCKFRFVMTGFFYWKIFRFDVHIVKKNPGFMEKCTPLINECLNPCTQPIHANSGLLWRAKYFMHNVIVSNRSFIFFCLFHRLNDFICYISDFFLPSRERKFGDNMTYCMDQYNHFICLLTHAFNTAEKNPPTWLKRSDLSNINIWYRPIHD